ncbi:Hypothetical Protein FCC1311_001572 [Hondaea fermentalgiana]|uniref:SPRY domain-containing protein n=1 Tax=Hondaea fermentalgiana TaxID=2315210 RepID=A0A2R5G2I6_9STRA|nr:Hypothetical Protein FCC1311_001572 [Hondaea fermentalgiana]|eukprot:GBG23938.1 Hypothetical Protein FCC1311_001572 [Hondaea fermentalgiana]
MGQIAKAQSDRFQPAKGRESMSRKSLSRRTTQEFDAAHHVPLWFEKICELEGATETESLQQTEIKKNETHMMRKWSEEARALVDAKVEENKLRDISELEDLQRRNEELDREGVMSWIGVEALSTIINPTERRVLAARSKSSRPQNERQVLEGLYQQKRELVSGYFQRSRMREAELSSSLQEGQAMLRRFGELLKSTCDNMISNNQSRLLEELHRHGVEAGRLRATDAASKLHRKISLNHLDRHQSVIFQHADATMLRLPSQERFLWGYAHASDGPWRVRRYDKGMVREIMRVTAEQINAEHASAIDVLRLLAKVLDAIQEASEMDVKLHKQVIETPRRARELIQTRLDALGIAIDVNGTSRLTKLRSELDIKTAAQQILAKTAGRVDYHGRFYFEIHAHKLSVAGLPSYQSPLSSGPDATDDADIPLGLFSLHVEQPRGRLSISALQQNEPNEPAADAETAASQNVPCAPENDDAVSELNSQSTEDETDAFLRLLERKSSSMSAEDLDYEEQDTDQWMIGVSFDTLQCNGFPGNDDTSFGLRSDGTLWHAGKCRSFCADLSDETVVGLLIDLNVGSLTPFVGGASLGVAFGVGSRAYSAEDQARQGARLREEHLIPAFALKAKARTDLELASSLSDIESLSEPASGDSDGALDALETQADPFPPNVDDNYHGKHDDDDDDQNHGDDLDHDKEARDRRDEDAGRIRAGTGDALAHEGAAARPLDVMQFTPALTVNFGGYPFARLPPHSLSCNAYMSFATESKMEIDRAQFEAKWRKERNASRGKGYSADDVESQESGAIEVVLEYKARAAFAASLAYESMQSWSDFPPEAHRIGYSASTLQRAARRFLGRRWRQREMLAQTLAITLLQQRIRDVMPAWRRRKASAASRIQKIWRGYRLRKQFRLAREFAHHPQLLDAAATKVQSTVRRRQAAKRAQNIAEAAEREIEFLVTSAHRIQNKWRTHKASREAKRYRAMARSVNLVQRLWRARAARMELDPAAREMLARIGHNVQEIQTQVNAATSVQRVWRGKADREYAHMRRFAYNSSAATIQFAWRSYRVKTKIDAICDWTLASNVKKFLQGIGAIL